MLVLKKMDTISCLMSHRYEALWQAGSYPVPGAFKEWSIVEEKKGIVIENM